MSDRVICGLNDFFAVFDEKISVSDILAAKVLAEISSVLAKKRSEMGMTQKQFAEYMDVSQGMVSRWESTDYNFSIRNLAEIADKLDLNLRVSFEKTMTKREKITCESVSQIWSKLVFYSNWQMNDKEGGSVSQKSGRLEKIQISNGGRNKWSSM